MGEDGPGRFITFEGGEGAGKSTQLNRLADVLETAGYPVVKTREPGGSPGAEAIRELLVTGDVDRWDAETELLLHVAARRDHVTKTVRPALQRGHWVLCDRFADSTMAYQGYGFGLDRETVTAAHRLALGDFGPDLTLILDLPVVEGLARAQARDGDGQNRYERMETAFHERLRQGFLEIARHNADRCAIIDATQDADVVHSAIFEEVSRRLSLSPR
jgi:dTMP kinase